MRNAETERPQRANFGKRETEIALAWRAFFAGSNTSLPSRNNSFGSSRIRVSLCQLWATQIHTKDANLKNVSVKQKFVLFWKRKAF